MTRVIAGSRGGRRLATPAGGGTRPTSDRVREALFSALTAWAGTTSRSADAALANLAFVDLYAGSGAVGLEAASRGADPVLLVEDDPRTAALILANVAALALPVQVRASTVASVLRSPPGRRYDIVFADPPYALASDALDVVVTSLLSSEWLAPASLVVLERSRRTPAPAWPTEMADAWCRDYGETVLYFAQTPGVAAADPATPSDSSALSDRSDAKWSAPPDIPGQEARP